MVLLSGDNPDTALKIAMIEMYDFFVALNHCCQLILFGITEPAGSVAGGIARGYVKKCKKDYLASKEGKEHQRLLKALKAEEDGGNKKKGKVKSDDIANAAEHEERKQDDATSEEGNQHDH